MRTFQFFSKDLIRSVLTRIVQERERLYRGLMKPFGLLDDQPIRLGSSTYPGRVQSLAMLPEQGPIECEAADRVRHSHDNGQRTIFCVPLIIAVDRVIRS